MKKFWFVIRTLIWIALAIATFAVVIFNGGMLPYFKAIFLYVVCFVLNIKYVILPLFKDRDFPLPIYSLPKFGRKPVIACILMVVLAPVFTVVLVFRLTRVTFDVIRGRF